MVAVAGAVILLGTVATGASYLRDHPLLPPASATACQIRDGGLLSADSLGGRFDKIVDLPMDHPPLGMGRNPNFSAAFLGAHLVGYVVDVAVTGPDRAAEDADAQRVGYTPGPFPLVPLTGDVVVHNPGLLEFYETAWSFSSDDGATLLINAVRTSSTVPVQAFVNGSSQPMPRTESLSLPNGVDGVFTKTVPADTRQETTFTMTTRRGSHVLQLTAQGGARLDLATVQRLFSDAETSAIDCRSS